VPSLQTHVAFGFRDVTRVPACGTLDFWYESDDGSYDGHAAENSTADLCDE